MWGMGMVQDPGGREAQRSPHPYPTPSPTPTALCRVPIVAGHSEALTSPRVAYHEHTWEFWCLVEASGTQSTQEPIQDKVGVGEEVGLSWTGVHSVPELPVDQ